MEKLLNFNESLDVNLLDRVVAALYTGKPDEINIAQKIMHQFKEHPQSWTRVDTILEYSQNPQTKYFALQILEDLIKSRWRILPKEQRDGIKNYIVNLVIKLSTSDDVRLKNVLLLGQSNKVLVQILKQEWPHNWEGFIPEIVGASKTNESLCENNMTIFKLLSEDVFEFSKDQMTQAKIKEMKTKFNNDFFLIYQLCDYIMNNTQKPSLLQATLETLLRFLSWIPLGYIFETNLVSGLISKVRIGDVCHDRNYIDLPFMAKLEYTRNVAKPNFIQFLPVPSLRNLVLQCLGEVAGLDVGENQNAQFQQMFKMFMEQIVVILPPHINIPQAYERGSDQDEQFIYYLSLFFTTFFKHHLTSVEQLQFHPMLLAGHQYLVQISLVNDPEIFKICLEYWNTLASSLYYEAPLISQPLLLGKPTQTPRRGLYSEILSKVREVMISRMARPEEVLISEDENGVITRIYLKDTENIALYKIMRETLIFLTHLDYEDTQNIMLRKLDAQVDGSEWGWGPLSTLCWAIGAIAGAQSEEMEKRFLVTVIRNLLELTEMKSGKDNKAVVASNIMFIVGQYPRFLRAHWKFLKTVVNKLFEFMHETHPGVQDMSCDTFLKIARKCKRKFVTVQQDERRPFIDEILDEIGNIISELQDQQVHTFFEAVGHMISAHHDPNVKAQLVARLMEMPNQTWAEIMKQAALNLAYLKQPATAAKLLNILKTNTRACMSLGHAFVSQLGRMYLDMLNVYKVYSEEISSIVATQGPQATRTQQVKSLRSVKSETLRLIETWIDKAEQVEPIVRDFLPPLLAAVLSDYKANIPNAREAEVLSLNAQIVNKCKGAITNEIPRIFDAIFECTLMMISKNFEDFPDFRVNFFNFIRAVNSHCFKAFFMMPPQVFKLVIDSIVWAFKHTMRNISETGLTILMELFDNISGTEVAAPFYQSYFLTLLQDLFVVLTDAFHKSGFSLQSALLLRMCNEVDSGKVQVPLWDPAKINDPTMTNSRFLREHICQLLAQSYPNLSQAQIMAFVEGLFSLKDLNLFKNHLRDFLVQIKEFAGGEDNAKLYEADKEAEAAKATKEETERNMQIPGMIPPNVDPRNEAESMLD